MTTIVVSNHPQVKTNWVRSPDGMFFGICKAMANRLQTSAWLIRLFWIITACALGSGLLLYIVLGFALPREDKLEKAKQPRLLGVCYNIARSLDADVGVVRAIALFLFLSSIGTSLIIYVLLAFVVPKPSAQTT